MRLKSLASNLSEYLLITIHSPQEGPRSYRIEIRRLFLLCTVLATAFVFLFLGTMLFFREMEITRKLESAVLQLEIEARVTQDLAQFKEIPAIPAISVPAKKTEPEPLKPTPEPVRAVAGEKEAKAPLNKKVTLASTAPVSQMEAPAPVNAKISSLRADCQASTCKADVRLAPEKTGSVQGELLMVLELVQSQPDGNSQARYLVYPGYEQSASFDINKIKKGRGNSFRFSRVLMKGVNFKVDPTFRPVAVNAYVRDLDGKVVQHKRQSIIVPEPQQ